MKASSPTTQTDNYESLCHCTKCLCSSLFGALSYLSFLLGGAYEKGEYA